MKLFFSLLQISLHFLYFAIATTLQSGYSWNSDAIDKKCPLFVLARTGTAGLGDQLEHYIFSLFLAKMFRATIIVEGFNVGPVKHSGASEYLWIASQLFGINMVLNLSYVSSVYNPKIVDISYDTALELHQKIISSNYSLGCNVMINTDVYSCKKEWCHLVRNFQSLKATLWTIRNNDAKSRCLKLQKYGLIKNSTTHIDVNESKGTILQVVWHVRQGDICLHCNDGDYYDRIFKMLNESLTGFQYKITFVSQNEMNFLRYKFPKSKFIHNSTLVESVCKFVTADIVITSGGSFLPMIAAFGGNPWRPLIFEEQIRHIYLKQQKSHSHYFSYDEAILMKNGTSQLSQNEINVIMKNVFYDRNENIHF